MALAAVPADPPDVGLGVPFIRAHFFSEDHVAGAEPAPEAFGDGAVADGSAGVEVDEYGPPVVEHGSPIWGEGADWAALRALHDPSATSRVRDGIVVGRREDEDFQELTEGELQQLSEANPPPALATGDGAKYDWRQPPFSLTDEQRIEAVQTCAFTEDGWLLVVAPHGTTSSYYRQLFRELNRQKEVVQHKRWIKLTNLRVLYKQDATLRAARRTGAKLAASYGEEGAARRLLRRLLTEASVQNCSDVHVMVDRDGGRVYMRVDGARREQGKYRTELGQFGAGRALLNTAYFLSDEVSAAMLREGAYQAGRISRGRYALPPRVQAVRMQFAPVAGGGQLLVMRLLYMDSVADVVDVDGLGYTRSQVAMIKRMRQDPFGLYLIAGVTGSGKSTTLQKCLSRLFLERRREVHVVCIEDPPEFTVEGASQLPVVGEGAGREGGYASAFEATLRLDPDVIMLGEVRDGVTARRAVAASLTGHQVWSTVHATSAVLSLERLIEEGVPAHRLLNVDVVRGLIGQRLLRRVCPACSVSWSTALRLGMLADQSEAQAGMDRILEAVPAWRAAVRVSSHGLVPDGVEPERWRRAQAADRTGRADAFADLGIADATPYVDRTKWRLCVAPGCRSGVVGRTVVAEVVVPDEEFMRAYRRDDGGPVAARAHWLQEQQGMTMAQHAFLKVVRGEIDPIELGEQIGWSELRSVDPSHLDSLGRVEYEDWVGMGQGPADGSGD